MVSDSEIDVETVMQEGVRMKNPSTVNHSTVLSQRTTLRICNMITDSGLLDEYDAQIISESFAILRYPKLSSAWKVRAFVSIGCLAGCIGYVKWTSILLIALLWLSIPFALVSVFGLFAIQLINYYIRSANSFDAAVQQLLSVIHIAEITTFGSISSPQFAIEILGRNDHKVGALEDFEVPRSHGLIRKPSARQQICMRWLRIDFLEMLRTAVDKQRSLSDILCRDDERKSLLWSVLTPEMAELTKNGQLNENFLKLPSLKELWQLYFMLRSEFLRLLFTTLLQSTTLETIALFIRSYRNAREMSDYSKKLNAVSRFIGQQHFGNDRGNKKRAILPTMGAFDRVRVRLQIASDLGLLLIIRETYDNIAVDERWLRSNEYGLSSESVNANISDVIKMLKEVIRSLNAESQQTQIEAVKQSDVVTVKEDSCMEESDAVKVPVCTIPSTVSDDQVFEALSHPDVAPSDSTSSFPDSVSKEVNEMARSVVNELESALLDRKREMKERERIALARFYGNIQPSDGTCAVSTDSDVSESMSGSASTPLSDSEHNESFDANKLSSQKSSADVDMKNVLEAEQNFMPYRPTASAWGNGLLEALRLRSTLPQQHFEDTGSADSEYDIVTTQQ